jgi:hypothetical protein
VDDITAAARPGQTLTVSYAPEPYVNSCRPTAPTCTCGDCGYNGGSHTEPKYNHSALLVIYKKPQP